MVNRLCVCMYVQHMYKFFTNMYTACLGLSEKRFEKQNIFKFKVKRSLFSRSKTVTQSKPDQLKDTNFGV